MLDFYIIIHIFASHLNHMKGVKKARLCISVPKQTLELLIVESKKQSRSLSSAASVILTEKLTNDPSSDKKTS